MPIIPPGREAEFKRLLNRDLKGRAQKSIEVKRCRKDGTIIDVSASSAPIRDQTGHVVAVMSILEDITQRKRSEEERANLQEQLHQTQKLEAVGLLAAGVAHDFNNLLTVIMGNVDRMNKLLTEQDERREVLSMIEEAARQATGVTRSLLTFSHKIPSVKRQTNLSSVVEESVRLLQRLLPATIDVSVEIPEDGPIWVIADRGAAAAGDHQSGDQRTRCDASGRLHSHEPHPHTGDEPGSGVQRKRAPWHASRFQTQERALPPRSSLTSLSRFYHQATRSGDRAGAGHRTEHPAGS